MADNIIRRKDKRTWGFTADENGQVTLGVPTSEKDGEDLLQEDDNEAARGNGGGFPAEDAVTYEYLQSLKAKELKALAASHGITLESKANASAVDIRAELAEYYEVEATKD